MKERASRRLQTRAYRHHSGDPASAGAAAVPPLGERATSEAHRCLGSTRRVVIPLLECLDRIGLSRRLADDRRELR